MFKLWSQTKPETKNVLKPDLGVRSWDKLSTEEKKIMWKHIEFWFYTLENQRSSWGTPELSVTFHGGYEEEENRKNRIFRAISLICNTYKVNNYVPNFLESLSVESACSDFKRLFLIGDENIVLEMLSLYSQGILLDRHEKSPYKSENEPDDDYKKRTNEWRIAIFDEFKNDLNEVLGDYGVQYSLSRQGFIPRQDEKIQKTLVDPVLMSLSGDEWNSVNESLSNAYSEFRTKRYGNSITAAVVSVEAFLQKLLGKDGQKVKLSVLVNEALKNKKIPDDVFSRTIFQNIESTFAQERQSKGGVHPVSEYATEKNALIAINMALLFIQHCIQMD